MDYQNQNQYYAAVPIAQETEETQAVFLRQTYMHVALAVLAFIAVEALFLNTPLIVNIGLSMTQGWTWLLVLGGFMWVTNMATRWAATSTEKNKQYLAFALFIVAEAFIFVPLIYIGIMVSGDMALINQAAVLTLSLFTGLSAVVLLTKKDFSFLKSALTIGFFIAIGLIVAGLLFGFTLGIWFSFAMVVLAAGSILYQTSNLFQVYHKGQYVAASLGLFASLMLLFWYILSIFMSSSD